MATELGAVWSNNVILGDSVHSMQFLATMSEIPAWDRAANQGQSRSERLDIQSQ